MEKNLTDEVEGESEFIELKKCDVDFFFSFHPTRNDFNFALIRGRRFW